MKRDSCSIYPFLVVLFFLLECLKVCKERVKCAQSYFCSGKEGHGVEEKVAREEGKRLVAN